MSAFDYKKELKLDKKNWKIIWGSLAALALAGIVFFFVYFRVEEVEVMGSSHYSKDEIREMILRGPLASNSVLAPLLYSTNDTGDIPFVEGFRVKQANRNTLVISVKEKKPVGCIPYLDSYVYFDRNGVFVESSRERDEAVPYFDGIQVNKVIKNEKLPIKGTTVLNTAVALATIFQKNQMIPDHIQFDQNYQINLVYGDITVQLGKDKYLEDKMSRVIAILPKLAGEKGILHLESVTDSTKAITFERDRAETEELEYALEKWVGGYDEELDYTGEGEYDQYGNYVGPKPTQESIEAHGDWKGGYNEEGGYTGTGEYDRDGNYVGPSPDAAPEEDANSSGDENGDSSYDEYGNYIGDSQYDEYGNYVGDSQYDEYGNYVGDSQYDAYGNYIGDSQYDAYGNYVEDSQYDAYGNYIGGE